MVSLSVEFVSELPDGREVIALARLDTETGEISEIKGLPEGVAPETAWVDVEGGSQLFFRVQRSGDDGRRYQVADMNALSLCGDQFEWLSNVAQPGGRGM